VHGSSTPLISEELSTAKFEDEKSSAELFDGACIAVHSTGCKVISQISGNSNPPRLDRMFELAMTPFCHDEVPSIIFDQCNDLADFQDDTSLLQIVLKF